MNGDVPVLHKFSLHIHHLKFDKVVLKEEQSYVES